MSNVTFGGLTFVGPDTLSFDNLPSTLPTAVVAFGSPLADQDVALKFKKGGANITATCIFWDDGVKDAMEKWTELKVLEGTVSTLVANGETLTNVVLISGGTARKEITDAGYIVTFQAQFRRLSE